MYVCISMCMSMVFPFLSPIHSKDALSAMKEYWAISKTNLYWGMTQSIYSQFPIENGRNANANILDEFLYMCTEQENEYIKKRSNTLYATIQ